MVENTEKEKYEEAKGILKKEFSSAMYAHDASYNLTNIAGLLNRLRKLDVVYLQASIENLNGKVECLEQEIKNLKGEI